ncbi:tissue factor isoform X2 [Bombina bombina]|uniref:tissue factor isoform X2 n=1 Tax=Bombina bombina TaxID=8345 RepID=UPI00235B14B4|nr:tissue factor isoform X2 [Bombina bombina]
MRCIWSLVLLCSVLCWSRATALDNLNFATAENITWASFNFKTILEWQPKPTNYVYTVEVAGEKSDWKRKCVYIQETECDVTDELRNVKDTFKARIISEVQDREDVLEEFPYANSPPFSPYQQTLIGSPSVESYMFNEDHTKLTAFIKDSLTPYRSASGQFETLRDIFKDDLIYTFFYWKSSSTGKKQTTSTNNEIKIDVEKGESYCFSVKATVQSRKTLRDSEESVVQCTSNGGSAASDFLKTSEYLYLCVS